MTKCHDKDYSIVDYSIVDYIYFSHKKKFPMKNFFMSAVSYKIFFRITSSFVFYNFLLKNKKNCRLYFDSSSKIIYFFNYFADFSCSSINILISAITASAFNP